MAVKDDQHAHRDPNIYIDLPPLPGHPSNFRVVGQQLVATSAGRRLHVQPRGAVQKCGRFSILVRVSLGPGDKQAHPTSSV